MVRSLLFVMSALRIVHCLSNYRGGEGIMLAAGFALDRVRFCLYSLSFYKI
jgi:hypothetical protein